MLFVFVDDGYLPQPHEDFLCIFFLCASNSSFVSKVLPQHSYFAFLLD